MTMMLKVINYSVKEEFFTLTTLYLDQDYVTSLFPIFTVVWSIRGPTGRVGQDGRM